MEPPAGFEPATTGSPGDFGARPRVGRYEAGALPLSYGGAPGLAGVAFLGLGGAGFIGLPGVCAVL